jgi:hypothetical protein
VFELRFISTGGRSKSHKGDDEPCTFFFICRQIVALLGKHIPGGNKWICPGQGRGASKEQPDRVKTMLLYMSSNIFYIRSPQPMTEIPDLTNGLNLLLCIVIFLLGYLVYRKQERISALLIGIGFGMFGLSHFTILSGIAFPEITFILLRVCGYILVAAGLWLLFSE